MSRKRSSCCGGHWMHPHSSQASHWNHSTQSRFSFILMLCNSLICRTAFFLLLLVQTKSCSFYVTTFFPSLSPSLPCVSLQKLGLFLSCVLAAMMWHLNLCRHHYVVRSLANSCCNTKKLHNTIKVSEKGVESRWAPLFRWKDSKHGSVGDSTWQWV